MRTIQNAVRRILIIVNLCAIKDALLRLLPKRTPPVIEQSEPVVETPPQAEEVYDEDNDVNARFAAWEEARDETMGQADDCERQGLLLLSRAALLRASVKSDDCGDDLLARELRAHANDVVLPELASKRPTLRLVGIDDTPIERGA